MAEYEEKSTNAEQILKILETLGEIYNSSLEIKEIWKAWQEKLIIFFGTSKIILLLFDEGEGFFSLEKSREILGKELFPQDEIKISLEQSPIIKKIVASCGIFTETNFAPQDPLFPLLQKEATTCLLGAPLKIKGKLTGILLFLKSGAAFSEEQKSAFQLVLHYLASLISGCIFLKFQENQKEAFKKQEELFTSINDELRKKQAALEAATQVIERDTLELEKLLQLKSDFISAVSHELRTPLTSINESVSLIQEGATGPLTDYQKKFLAIAKNNMDRLSRLINDLLDFSKIEAGKLRLNKKVTKMEVLVSEAVKTFSLEIAKKQIDFKVNFIDQIPRIYLDADRLVQIILNLLNNALKFTPTGGKINVEIKVVTDFPGFSEIKDLYPVGQKFVRLSVSDTGRGIKKEDLEKLFQKFQQVETGLGRHYRGIGLGLVISRELVEMHGGRIWVESEFQKGSAFRFVVPLKEPPKILAVDDEPSVVEAVSLVLETRDYQIFKAYDGAEALEVVKKTVPDLIILDIRMPKMDGYEVVKNLKQDEVFNKIPILILSGYTIDTGLLKSFGLGRVYSIAKPFNAEELLGEVEQLLKGE